MDSPITGTRIESITVRALTPAHFARAVQVAQELAIEGGQVRDFSHDHRDTPTEYARWVTEEGTRVTLLPAHPVSTAVTPGAPPPGERSRPL